MTALTAMPATARLRLARLGFARFIAEKPVATKMVCQFPDTTAPTKEGLSGDDKIVSNLHELMSRWGI